MKDIMRNLKAEFADTFIRTKEEPDKDKLRAELTDEQLAKVGLRIEQEDRFFVEPRVESGERAVAA